MSETKKYIKSIEGYYFNDEEARDATKKNAEKIGKLSEEIAQLRDGDELKKEELSIVPTASYPDVTTFEYTESDAITNYGYCVVKRGLITGGTLAVEYNKDECSVFDLNLYVYDADGQPYLVTDAADAANAAKGTGFKGELYYPVYKPAGQGNSYGTVLEPFTTKIPEGCSFIASIRFVPNGSIGGTVVNNGTTFRNWALSGGVSFVVTENGEDSGTILHTNLGKENANKNICTDENGTVIAKDPEIKANINPNIKSINHRGYGEAPENTLSAYRLSKKKGFDFVECDISMTADGVAVLLHDATIDRTSDGSGNIADLTLAQVREYDFGSWKSEEYAGEKIPTFVEFISLCKNLGLHPYIELKSSGNYTQEQILELINTVKAMGMRGKVTWISFNLTYLQTIANADASARIGYVVDTISQSNIDAAKAMETEKNEVFLDAYYPYVTPDLVALCVSSDVPLEVWGIDNASDIVASDPYVSGFTTDNSIAGAELYKYALTHPTQEKDDQNNFIFITRTTHSMPDGAGLLSRNNEYRSLILSTCSNGSPEIRKSEEVQDIVEEPVYLIAIPNGKTKIKVTCPDLKWAYRGTSRADLTLTYTDSGWMESGETHSIPDAEVRCLFVFAKLDDTAFDETIDYMQNITIAFE